MPTIETASNPLDAAHGDDMAALSAVARVSANRQNRTRCQDCGTIESMRAIEHSTGAGSDRSVGVKSASGISADASGNPVAANAIPGMGFEFTVRFRDGSTAVFQGYLTIWDLRTHARLSFAAGDAALDPNKLEAQASLAG